ncbi:MAG: transposase [Planctomycetota bacterium]
MQYPLAYLITFSTYGTWLHGDNRGSIDKDHNSYCSPFIATNPGLTSKERSILKNPSVTLNKAQREAVLTTILHVCDLRAWFAHAVHVRAKHVHLVVAGSEKPERMMATLKAYATRAIKGRPDGHAPKKFWTRHGSTKYLWTEASLAAAIRYVKYEQGDMMAFGASEPPT